MIFKGFMARTLEPYVESLNEKVNKWISENEAKGFIVNKTESFLASDNGGNYTPTIFISVWMESSNFKQSKI